MLITVWIGENSTPLAPGVYYDYEGKVLQLILSSLIAVLHAYDDES